MLTKYCFGAHAETGAVTAAVKEGEALPYFSAVKEGTGTRFCCPLGEDDVVFGYFEYTGDDYAADMAKMAADPTTQDWWAHTRPCFTKYKPDSPEAFYTDMQQIFFFE